MLKWILILLGAPVAMVALELLAVSWLESRQTLALEDEQPYSGPAGSSRTAVVYFSRSGNTALAARHVPGGSMHS